ncbi:MAG: Gfo/Idh/MocA family protein [Planctomycetia bacterium]
MVRIGIVGLGFMGMIHYLAAKRAPGVQVVAFATRDAAKRAGDWTGIQGNFGPRGTQEDLTGVTPYASVEELLADSAVDLVDVCLPNDQHRKTVVQALEAGKHVLVEKAIALSLADADAMLAAAAAANRRLLVAHVLPYFADFAYALKLTRDGDFGTLRAAHFRRHISPPDWSAAMADSDCTGGPIVDLHIHDTHFIATACGLPKAVYSRGILNGGSVDYVATQYLYDAGGPIVTATSGAVSAKGRPFTHGYEMYFEKATLLYEAGGPVQLFTDAGVQHPELGSSDPIDAFAAELSAAATAVSTGHAEPTLEGTTARNALALCLKEAESVKTGAVVAL